MGKLGMKGYGSRGTGKRMQPSGGLKKTGIIASPGTKAPISGMKSK